MKHLTGTVGGVTGRKFVVMFNTFKKTNCTKYKISKGTVLILKYLFCFTKMQTKYIASKNCYVFDKRNRY